jgi:hypothetical protein
VTGETVEETLGTMRERIEQALTNEDGMTRAADA